MKYIDIHAHLNFAAYDTDRADVISRIKNNNVFVINVGTQINTSTDAVVLAEQNDNMFATIGLHPIHVNHDFADESEISPESSGFTAGGENFDRERFLPLISHKKVVAVGECGLDFFHISRNVQEYKQRQEENFRKQIDFALEFDKPIMIHCRDAYSEVLTILKEYKKTAGRKLRGNIHFFAGSVEQAREFLNIDFTISFTGVITFASQYEELVKFVPLDRIHAETDSPYVAPAPFRGKRNEPTYVIEVAKRIAEIKGENIEKVSEQLLSNAKTLFNLPI
ncbi:MAG TPA: TatD family hydrolase [Candidatus Paceibacterota bacterium]|nr:TatD family hydrolase [Candidatus Paceibacterota bacterium]